MNFIEFKNNKLGMTLVEMVISLLVLSILMTSTMGIIVSSNSIFISTSQAALDRQIGNGVYDTMESILKYATELYVTDNKPTEKKYTEKYKKYIYLTDTTYYDETDDDTKSESECGHIIYEKNGDILNLYESGYYKGRTIQYTVTPVGSNGTYLRLTVAVVRDNEIVYKRSATINCLNLTSNSTRFVTNSTKKHNQCLCYNSDYDPQNEESSWYLEYKAAQYIAKYNKILSDYYNAISPVYETYKNTLTGKNESGEYISARNSAGQISYANFLNARNTFNKAIFGTDANPTTTNVDSTNYTIDFEKLGIAGLDGTASKGNLRLYYQKQIYDLLGFTPTRAFKDFTDTQNLDNPYYGVAATKEELYYGFLLKNYDGKGEGGKEKGIEKDGHLTKNEYPGLPEYYYDGTIFAKNYEDVDAKKYNYNADDMVILGYFYDNTNDTYNSSLFDADGIVTRINWYTQTDGLKVDGTNWVATSAWNHANGVQFSVAREVFTGADIWTNWVGDKAAYHPDEGVQSYSVGTYRSKNYNYDYKYTDATFDTTNLKGPDNKDAYYTLYSDKYYTVDNDATGIDGINEFLTDINSHIDGNTFATKTLASKLVATELDSTNAIISNVTQHEIVVQDGGTRLISPSTSKYRHNTIGITPTVDLPEGWYYIRKTYNSGNKTEYMYFYLKGTGAITVSDAYGNSVTSNNAVLSNSSVSYKEGQYAIYLTLNIGNDDCYEVKNISYQQAQMSKGAGGKTVMATGATDVVFHDIKKHQYIDWQLYQVDWNSWFTPTSSTKGIFNAVVGAFNKVINYVTGESENAADISYVDYLTAEKVLGVTGCNNITIGSDRHLRSYNAAAVVYDASRSTWYYLPDTSNKISQAMDNLPISSKDAPIFVDVEFATSQYHTSSDRQYSNSKAISYDISNRKLTKSALWGMTDATTDVIWSSLPANSSGINRLNLSMPAVNIDPTFTYAQKTYSATTTSSSTSILASFISNEYRTSDIHILIKVNDKVVENGSAVNWKVGTNKVTIDVYKIKSRNVITSAITDEKILSDYSGYNITVNYTPAG